jgi:hypothetical protein
MSSDSTSHHKSARPRKPAGLIAGVVAGLACAAAGLAFILAAPLPGTTAEASTLGRGIVDYRLEQPVIDASAIHGMVVEMGPGNLGARWTRVLVHWNKLQPSAPTGSETSEAQKYDAAYLAQLDNVVTELTTVGISIVFTPLDVPEWASDERLWKSPQAGYKAGVYEPFYAPDMSTGSVASAQYKALGTFLAARYNGSAGHGKVGYFEAWNEPNQGQYLYPQTPVSAKSGGGATYLKMLKQWYAGVKAGNAQAQVIAGATAPRGRGDAGSTPPQAFARYLQANGAGAYMDAYSHHPYTPGGSTRIAPDSLPNNPARCVTLGNLSQLTRLFPTKPFYLTEYGYNTQYSVWFGVTVSPAVQAAYLRQAYSYTASHYKQVKALFWFLVDDLASAPGAFRSTGVYMGVRTSAGERKPSWYAFAGGNRLTLAMPASAKAGAPIPISGALTYKQLAGAPAQTLSVQARTPSSSTWKTVATVKTDPATGAFSRTVTQSQTKVYRVVWGGVCESVARTVRTP